MQRLRSSRCGDAKRAPLIQYEDMVNKFLVLLPAQTISNTL